MTIDHPAHPNKILREYPSATHIGETARWRRAARICSAALIVSLSACSTQTVRDLIAKLPVRSEEPAQSAVQPAPPPPPVKVTKHTGHGKSAEPKPEPTQDELIEYLRGKLLSLSPNDGYNDNLEVRFDPSTSVLTIIQPNNRCDHFLNALDTNNISWDIFNPSDTHETREELLRLTVTSSSGKTARACFDKKGRPEEGVTTNRVRLLFSLAKTEQVPGFRDKIVKCLKELVVLSGGTPENDIFKDASANHPRSGSK